MLIRLLHNPKAKDTRFHNSLLLKF